MSLSLEAVTQLEIEFTYPSMLRDNSACIFQAQRRPGDMKSIIRDIRNLRHSNREAVIIEGGFLFRSAISCPWDQACDQSSTLPRIASQNASRLHFAAQVLRDSYHHNALVASRVVADVSVCVLFGHFDGRQDFEVKCRLVFSARFVSISSFANGPPMLTSSIHSQLILSYRAILTLQISVICGIKTTVQQCRWR